MLKWGIAKLLVRVGQKAAGLPLEDSRVAQEAIDGYQFIINIIIYC